MNCPAKNHDSDLKHPDWNQSPPFLAPELTTRQDLNGLANSRERGNSTDGVADGRSGGHNEMLDGNFSSSDPGITAVGLEERPSWLSSKKKAAGSNCHSRLLFAGQTSSISQLWDWIVWFGSVLICSYFLSAFQQSRISTNLVVSKNEAEPQTLAAQKSPHRPRSTCPTGGISDEDYNRPLHIGALFIILFISTTACAFPLLATRFPKLRIPAPFFFVVRHFGTGVLIATAFVHLLPTAFILLGNPCLSDFWVSDYPAMPGAIALAGVFFVIVIEMVFHPSRRLDLGSKSACSGQPTGILSNTTGQENSEVVHDAGPNDQTIVAPAERDVEKDSQHYMHIILTPEQKLEKDVLQCILLEVGILFHSVFIGMALSVSIGREFIILLIAIAFHQTFEGLALGSRIADIPWQNGTLQPWFMALAYGCTTPIGQAIGIATSSLYSPDSEVGLILVGAMNAISAGLLVFASLVELLSEDFLSYESWRVLRAKRRVFGCLLVFFGAFCMSLVGAWA
ncbi:hypothetical protein TWF718_004043 [Orbilia javanica]|uniref:Uncharacterized protein n=1 Tax=Orbilia javanica TaxID=47235 RepID=A0AAN8RF84_9PEZI